MSRVGQPRQDGHGNRGRQGKDGACRLAFAIAPVVDHERNHRPSVRSQTGPGRRPGTGTPPHVRTAPGPVQDQCVGRPALDPHVHPQHVLFLVGESLVLGKTPPRENAFGPQHPRTTLFGCLGHPALKIPPCQVCRNWHGPASDRGCGTELGGRPVTISLVAGAGLGRGIGRPGQKTGQGLGQGLFHGGLDLGIHLVRTEGQQGGLARPGAGPFQQAHTRNNHDQSGAQQPGGRVAGPGFGGLPGPGGLGRPAGFGLGLSARFTAAARVVEGAVEQIHSALSLGEFPSGLPCQDGCALMQDRVREY